MDKDDILVTAYGDVSRVKELPRLRFKKLHPHAQLPKYQTEGAAGMDVHAVLIDTHYTYIYPGERLLVSTGLAAAVPPGYELQVRPRSGLAANFGVTVLNSPGTIDSDYRGEIKVLLVNTGKDTYRIDRGDRIAQLVLAEAPRLPVVEVEDLDDTERGAGGFGSSGT